jgi:hypothetical protein
MVAKGKQIIIARHNQIGISTDRCGQHQIVIRVPTDGFSKFNRSHASNQSGIAIKQIRNHHATPLNRLLKLRALQHTLQLSQ